MLCMSADPAARCSRSCSCIENCQSYWDISANTPDRRWIGIRRCLCNWNVPNEKSTICSVDPTQSRVNNNSHLLVFIFMQNVAIETSAFVCAATRCDAHLFALLIRPAFSDLRTILLIFTIQTIHLAIADVLLIDTNVRVWHILERWTHKLSDFALNRTLAFVFATFAIRKPIAEPRFLHEK